MTKVLFVCLGNICRSPMAECVFNTVLERNNAETLCKVDSAGILSYHQGEQPDRRMREMAKSRGYTLIHESRPVKTQDFFDFDIIIGMDESNIEDLKDRAPSVEAMDKIHRISEFFSPGAPFDHIPDPYYGGTEGFNTTVNLLEDACENLYEWIAKGHK